jgi:hypothetical protein
MSRPTRPRLAPAPLRWLAAPLLLMERARGRWRLALALLYLALAMLLGAGLWWATCLRGLPDVGEPFDLAAFRAVDVRDEDNAFVLYRQAGGELNNDALSDPSVQGGWTKGDPTGRSRLEDRLRRSLQDVALGGWAKAGPEARRWLADNGRALATWRRGTERPDAMAIPPHRLPANEWVEVEGLTPLVWLALLEGARLESDGDMEGAWGWYRAADRAAHHAMSHSGSLSRAIGVGLRDDAIAAAGRWAADPRVDAPLLRRALGDALAIEAMAPSDAYTLRVDYLRVARYLEDRAADYARPSRQGHEPDWYMHIWVPGLGELDRARVVLNRDVERSRRVLRLAFAHWIALAESGGPISRPAIRALKPYGLQGVDFFDLGPAAPAKARALTPRELARWFESETLAQGELIHAWNHYKTARSRERAGRGDLSLLLAEQLYRREHGAPPPSTEALVGPYLKRLPRGDRDVADDTVPTTRR